MADRAAIEVKSLTYTYPDGTKALDDVSFEAARGESVALVGPSGAGKTTLILCIAGFLEPTGGVILIDGVEVKKKSIKDIRAKIGLIFQNADDQLFMPTLYEDVAFGPLNRGVEGKELDAKVNAALSERGLAGLENKFPGHLSGGQKRLASLASVLVMSPQILLLDEPSSNLDPKSRRQLINHLRTLDVARVLASHDLEMVLELCSRAILFDGGKIISNGDPAKILSDAALMERHSLEVPHSLHPHPEQHHYRKP